MPAKRKQEPQTDKETIVTALLTQPNKTAAARALGMSRTALYKRLKADPAILEECQSASSRALQKMTERAEMYATGLVDKLWGIATDPETPPGTRVYALNSIAAIIYKGENTDVQRKQLKIAQQRANDAQWN